MQYRVKRAGVALLVSVDGVFEVVRSFSRGLDYAKWYAWEEFGPGRFGLRREGAARVWPFALLADGQLDIPTEDFYDPSSPWQGSRAGGR